MSVDIDIHKQAKQRFLEKTGQYECCGALWSHGSPCLAVNCPIRAEIERVKKQSVREIAADEDPWDTIRHDRQVP